MPTSPAGTRTLALTTLQQAGLTLIRFGLPALAPFVREDLGLTLVQIGLLLAALDLGGFLAFIPTGLLADRWGERRVLVAGGVAMGAMAGLAALAPTYGLLVVALLAAGLGFPSGHTAGSKMVMRSFPPRARGLAMGIRQAGLPIGGALAAVLIPSLAGIGGWRPALAAVGGLCALFGLLCATLPRDPDGAPDGFSPRRTIRVLAADRDFLLITLTMTALVVGQFSLQGYLPLFMVDERGWGPSAAGRLLALVHLGGISGRLLWGALSDRLAGGRRRPVLAWVTVGGAAALLVLSRFPSGIGAGTVSAFAFAAGLFLVGWNGLAVTMVVERAGPGRAATALGVALTVLFVGTMASSPLFGWVVETTGAYAPAWLLVVAVQAAAWILLRQVGEREHRT